MAIYSPRLARSVGRELRKADAASLEFEDIQHFLIYRSPALAARYEFLTFRKPAAGRAWLRAMTEKVTTAAAVRSGQLDTRWVTVARSWNGIRALGLDDHSLASFPEEFRQGMATRAEVLGMTGANHPEHWKGGLANTDLHAIVILFARDVPERERCRVEHEKFLSQCQGVEVLSSLDLEAIPPFDYPHEHFGYRDRLSQPVIEGNGEGPMPGSVPAIKAGDFLLGYPDEEGTIADGPEAEILLRNGRYLAVFKTGE